MRISDDQITFHNIKIAYKPSTDSSFHIRRKLKARSHSFSTANEKASRIDHEYRFENDTMFLNTNYSFPKSDKIRDQEVAILIEIPKNGKVQIGERTIELGVDDEEDYEYYYEYGKLRHNGSYDHWD